MKRRISSNEELSAWFAGRIPDGWFNGPPLVRADREEILVIGTLTPPDVGEADDDALRIACLSRIQGHREDTRAKRMRVAADAEVRFGRKVSWGAACGAEERLFTTVSAPVMTRLRMDERAVLDTLIDAGVARSRSEALGWCVRLVARHQGDWIDQLRDAMAQVEEVRRSGPDSDG